MAMYKILVIIKQLILGYIYIYPRMSCFIMTKILYIAIKKLSLFLIIKNYIYVCKRKCMVLCKQRSLHTTY